MKSLNECINESLDVNEGFLSFGLTVIVAIKLAGIALAGMGGLFVIWNAFKSVIKNNKAYQAAIIELDELLAPYKNDLLNKELAGKLFGENDAVTDKALRTKGFSIVYEDLEKEIKSVLSADDFKRYKEIADDIYRSTH